MTQYLKRYICSLEFNVELQLLFLPQEDIPYSMQQKLHYTCLGDYIVDIDIWINTKRAPCV